MFYPHNLYKSHDDVLLGAKMNAKCHIWVSVCVVLTSTQVTYFRNLQLLEVNNDIKSTTVTKNQTNLCRVYLLHPSICLALEDIML